MKAGSTRPSGSPPRSLRPNGLLNWEGVRHTGLRMRGRRIISGVEPFVWRLRRVRKADQQPGKRMTLMCIYRQCNEQRVSALCKPVIEAGGSVCLWALDEVSADLEPYTRGRGHGSRCGLLNNLVEVADLGEGDIVVISDDDVEFARGNIPHLVALSESCGFVLAQPAHTRDSNISYTFTFASPWLRARRTRFVEIGPVLVVSAAFRTRMFPLPLDSGMGWGLEARWHSLLESNESFGIVDDVAIRHLGVVADDYASKADEELRRDMMLAVYGLTNTKQLCITTGRWWNWQPQPPWIPIP